MGLKDARKIRVVEYIILDKCNIEGRDSWDNENKKLTTVRPYFN